MLQVVQQIILIELLVAKKKHNLTIPNWFFFHPVSMVTLILSPGVSEYLSTEICTSRQKRFSLVTFVDSPGLVDGDMKYPFDVDEVILWLGEGTLHDLVYCYCGSLEACSRWCSIIILNGILLSTH